MILKELTGKRLKKELNLYIGRQEYNYKYTNKSGRTGGYFARRLVDTPKSNGAVVIRGDYSAEGEITDLRILGRPALRNVQDLTYDKFLTIIRGRMEDCV